MTSKTILRINVFLAFLLAAGIASFLLNHLTPHPVGLAGLPPGLLLTATAPATRQATPLPAGSKPSPAASSTPFIPKSVPTVIHAIRADYTDMAASRSQVKPLEQAIQESGFNLVSLGAGRAEWTYFKWSGHTAQWSSDVKSTGVDFLAEDSGRFGAWAHVDAAVDVLSPLYIQQHPEAAAISLDGTPSPNLVSTMQLVEGPYGQQLLDMITAIASGYPVDSISVNELAYHLDGYGPDDKSAYLAYSRRTDWPRLPNGAINPDDPGLVTWRSYEVNRFLGQARDIAHRYGKSFYANLTLALGPDGLPLSTDLAAIQALNSVSDRVILWNNLNLSQVTSQQLARVADALAPVDHNRVIFVIGLWGQPTTQPITPLQLQSAMQVLQQHGFANLWITPASLMTTAHWQAAAAGWMP